MPQLNQKAPVETGAFQIVYLLFYFFGAFLAAFALTGLAVKTIRPMMPVTRPTSSAMMIQPVAERFWPVSKSAMVTAGFAKDVELVKK